MKIDIPLLIVGLIIIYVYLSVEPFNNVLPDINDIQKKDTATKTELKIKPIFLKGLLPLSTPHNQHKRGDNTLIREDPHKYIRESMLLNKPNNSIGFLPSNTRYVDLTYATPNEIGKLPIFRGKIPKRKIKVPKLPNAEEEESVE